MKEAGQYDPKPTKYPFPLATDEHYLVVKKDDGTVFDASYPYVDRSKGFLFKQKMVRLLLILIVFPMTRIKMGLRIIGKENLRKHKDELKGGAVTVSNHVHMWDYLALRCALKKKDMAVLCWKKNVSGETGALVRLVGGIPIPEDDIKATHAFKKATDEFLNGGYVQIYAEGSMWEYYRPIRPFRTGAALFAIDNDKPVLPMAFSYRKPSFLRKMFGQWATFTLNIGEPLYANPDLEKKEAQMDLTKRLHDEVCRLAGIDPEKNIYKPIFDNDTRIDYYDALRQ